VDTQVAKGLLFGQQPTVPMPFYLLQEAESFLRR